MPWRHNPSRETAMQIRLPMSLFRYLNQNAFALKKEVPGFNRGQMLRMLFKAMEAADFKFSKYINPDAPDDVNVQSLRTLFE